MRVSVYHNVARDEAGRRINGFGYESGHPIVHVFEAETDLDWMPASELAEMVWIACNVNPDRLGSGRLATFARAYRDRRLRSLSVGDVVVLGEGEDRMAMRADTAGFSFVRTDQLNIVTIREHGTQPWSPDARPFQV
jgi:hypothetical protein